MGHNLFVNAHLWLLHFLFLDEINVDADSFSADWNHHPLSGQGTHNQSPHDLFFLGQTSEGIDTTDFDNVLTDLLHQDYGVHGPRQYRLPTETGAGHPTNEQVVPDASNESPMDEDDNGEEDTSNDATSALEQLVADSIQTNIRHAPVKVQRHACPFNPEQVQAFGELLAEILLSPLQPVDVESWGTTESIPLGQRKELRVDLAGDIWLLRARKWVLAAELFTRVT